MPPRTPSKETVTPARNRVTPMGDIEAFPLRGAWTGNRGILHSGRSDRPLPRERPLDHLRARVPGPLARAVAAPSLHVPLLPRRGGLLRCRTSPLRRVPPRELRRYRAAWANGLGVALPSAKLINRQLHGERIVRGTHRRRIHRLPWRDLPDGTFVLVDNSPALVLGDQLREWTRNGLPGPTAAADPRNRGRHHTALDRRRARAPATRSRSTTLHAR